MNTKDSPAGRDEAEMIAESRLDYLLDAVEAPKPSVELKRRIYELGSRPPVAAGATARPRFGGWLAAGPALRPVGAMAALACTLLIGIVVGRALPDGAAPVVEVAPPQPLVVAGPVEPPQPLVIAGLADLPREADPLSVDSFSLVVPRPLQAGTASDARAEDDDVGSLPLY